jgi:hypothetical protein
MLDALSSAAQCPLTLRLTSKSPNITGSTYIGKYRGLFSTSHSFFLLFLKNEIFFLTKSP